MSACCLAAVLLLVGATRPFEWLLDLHVAASAVGAVLVGAHAWRMAPLVPVPLWAIRGGLAALALAALLTPALRAAWDADWRAERIAS